MIKLSVMTESALPFKVNISNDVLFQIMDQEYVLLNTQTEMYFGLDEVAARFWQLFSEGSSTQSAIEKVLTEYEVDRVVLENDLNNLLQKLESDQLITFER
jgi:hypothetical protein